jgi:penicillin-binding protein 1A
MGNGQYGFGSAAQYYFGRPLSALTAGDADKAALLASIPKSPRDYAPTAPNKGRLVRRRNQTLALMADAGFLSHNQEIVARQRLLPAVNDATPHPFQSSAVVAHVLDELAASYTALGVEDLLQGRVQVHTTVDARVQRIANDALQHGLERLRTAPPARTRSDARSSRRPEEPRRQHPGRSRRARGRIKACDLLQ